VFQIGRLVFDLAFENIIHVAVVAHPSLLKPEDLEVRQSQTARYCTIPPEHFIADLHLEEQGSSPDQ
jgi:hypothetical protein